MKILPTTQAFTTCFELFLCLKQNKCKKKILTNGIFLLTLAWWACSNLWYIQRKSKKTETHTSRPCLEIIHCKVNKKLLYKKSYLITMPCHAKQKQIWAYANPALSVCMPIKEIKVTFLIYIRWQYEPQGIIFLSVRSVTLIILNKI